MLLIKLLYNWQGNFTCNSLSDFNTENWRIQLLKKGTIWITFSNKFVPLKKWVDQNKSIDPMGKKIPSGNTKTIIRVITPYI